MALSIVGPGGIETISGALKKPKKQNGHNHGNYVIMTHRTAATTNPNCQRIYVKAADAYKRSTPVTADEQAQRARFAAIARAVAARGKDMAQTATDIAAFNAQKDQPGGLKTLKAYRWNICATAYDQNNG